MSRIWCLTFLFILLFHFQLPAEQPAYGVYGLHITGSPRLLGMGGAFVGLADDASAVITNPAGISMSRWTFDIQGTTNKIINREGDTDLDGLKDGIPYSYLYNTLGLKLGIFGFGVGYTNPYTISSNLGGLSSVTQEVDLQSTDFSVSISLIKSLSVGGAIHLEKATMSLTESLNNSKLEDESETSYLSYGILFKPQSKWGFGISYTGPRRHEINENLNNNSIGFYDWFQDLVVPAKLSLGFSLKAKSNLTFVGDLDTYIPQKNTFLIGSDGFNSEHKFIDKQYSLWHGGFEFSVVDKKNLEFIWRGGGYQEPARLVDGDPRFHFTMGVEVRFGPIKFSSAYDQAKNFTSFSQAVGISINDLKF